MNDLGEVLKKERLKKGLTLEDIQDITKVRIKYLKAIEDGNFDVIPAVVYTKGFIKSYAEAVGLDPQEIMNQYGYLFEEKEKEEEEKYETASDELEKKNSFDLVAFLRSLVKPFIGIIVIGLFAYGLFYIVSEINKGAAPLPSNVSTGNSSTNVSNNSSKDNSNKKVTNNKVETTTVTEVNNTKNEVDYKVVPVGNTFKVDLSVPGQKCWVRVIADNNTSEYYMTTGMVKSFDVNSNIEILMGNPPDAQIKVDGKEIPHINIPAPITVKLTK